MLQKTDPNWWQLSVEQQFEHSVVIPSQPDAFESARLLAEDVLLLLTATGSRPSNTSLSVAEQTRTRRISEFVNELIIWVVRGLFYFFESFPCNAQVRVKHVTQRVTFVTQHVRNSTCVSACQPARRFYNHAPKYQNMPSRLSKKQGGAVSVAEFRS